MGYKKKIVFRLDDISWDMNYEKFSRIRDIFIKHNVRPLIGVIPCNKDDKLNSQVGNLRIHEDEFWREISTLQNKYGWDIAIHGYDHVYITDNAGLMGINKRSEFAGVSYDVQNDKIKKAIEIFKKRNIISNVFMAPAHSFDWNTVAALKNNGIYLITDGQCEYPYCRKGVWFIPQVRPFISTKGKGYDTVCFHINKFNEENFIAIENFLKHHKEICVSFSDVVAEIKTHNKFKWILGNLVSKPKQFLKNLYRFKFKESEAKNIVKERIVFLLKKIYICLISSHIGNFIRFKPYMDDKKYIKKLYKKRFGVYPNLECPQNFNEKINWRKIYDRNPVYTDMVDKYKVKEFVEHRLGKGYTFPLLGVWNKAKEIDFSSLPQQFVLKANHAGGVIICRDKNGFDTKKAVKELNILLKHNYYLPSREWVYKNVERKIIAEKYMGENLIDFKNYCFNGKLHYTFVWKNISREDGRKPLAHFCGAYDTQWKKTDIGIDYPSANEMITKPECYYEMVKIVETLSKDIPFLRVDCYIMNDHVYVGEMTFYPWGGFQKFKSEERNIEFGKLLKL